MSRFSPRCGASMCTRRPRRLLNAFSSYYVGGEFQQTISVGLLMLILLLKPEGLLGSKSIRPV